MINSHAHLDFDHIHTIAENAVAIVPSVGKQNWQQVQVYPYFSLGIHPWLAESHTQQDLDALEYLIKCSNPIAIGECGLDFAKDIDRSQQLYIFECQLQLAETYKLPVIIHAVKATEEVILLLTKYPKVTGEIHGFSGSEAQAKTLAGMEFYLGFGLQILNDKSLKLRRIARNLALKSLLIETDDHANPNDLMLVAEKIAQLKQISVKNLSKQCDNNAILLFGLQ
ncbi:TatD DNase family protein [Isorropodon fossajaponicum endosymbiont JTNG4]|uniref:TatD family hydrolase n=1 Tax=Isorropodon fossajaponicum symbiont TaxID=883811 RepID=UPI0019151E0F|nr:TatD family hydrolase [Isorropodon fossajaponicum symbiont]BBB23444.1 TatD DNase family protein [Isorropodon fossajaponicum endosymbiont JTNG4]